MSGVLHRVQKDPAGPQPKKNTTSKVFFLLWPRAGAQRGFSFPCRSRGRSKKKKHPGWCFVFCSGPVPASNGASPSLAFRRGRSQKKKNSLGGVFFLLWPRAGAQRGFSFPCLSPEPEQKKTPWVVFFFCCGPARTLTHSLRAWVAMPPPRRGGVFFFAAGRGRTGVVFFFFAVAPPGRSLTHGGLGRFRQGPGGVFFFWLRPRRVFLDNNKKCLGYYIGSKKTRRGHSKKKKHHFHHNKEP